MIAAVYMTTKSSAITVPSPGTDRKSASTMYRRLGSTLTRRSRRSTRTRRSTANPPASGIREMPTTTRSNQFQTSRKNTTPRARILRVSSRTKKVRKQPSISIQLRSSHTNLSS